MIVSIIVASSQAGVAQIAKKIQCIALLIKAFASTNNGRGVLVLY